MVSWQSIKNVFKKDKEDKFIVNCTLDSDHNFSNAFSMFESLTNGKIGGIKCDFIEDDKQENFGYIKFDFGFHKEGLKTEMNTSKNLMGTITRRLF